MKKLFYIIPLTIVLSACGAKGTSFTGMTNPSPGNAKIYVYRPSAMLGNGVRYSVYATNQQNQETVIGFLRSGGYVTTELPAGNYEIWARTEAKRHITVTLKPDEITCIKAGVGVGFFVGRPELDHVSLEQCQRELHKTKLSYRNNPDEDLNLKRKNRKTIEKTKISKEEQPISHSPTSAHMSNDEIMELKPIQH